MTQSTSGQLRSLLCLTVAAAIAGSGLPAFAQASAPKAAAVAPSDPATEKLRAEHDLAQAAFARPDARPMPTTPAAKIASEAADAKAAAPAEPKAEWLSKEGVHRGGKGLQISSPF